MFSKGPQNTEISCGRRLKTTRPRHWDVVGASSRRPSAASRCSPARVTMLSQDRLQGLAEREAEHAHESSDDAYEGRTVGEQAWRVTGKCIHAEVDE